MQRLPFIRALAATALLALALGLLTQFGEITIWLIYALTALQAIAISFDSPARQALIPNLVPAEPGTYVFVNSMVILAEEPVIVDTGAAMANVTVKGNFAPGGAGSCVTSSLGSCTITSATIRAYYSSTVFTVGAVSGFVLHAPAQLGQRLLDETMDADALQADRVEHAGGRLDDPGRRVAVALFEEYVGRMTVVNDGKDRR